MEDLHITREIMMEDLQYILFSIYEVYLYNANALTLNWWFQSDFEQLWQLTRHKIVSSIVLSSVTPRSPISLHESPTSLLQERPKGP
mmetsp:Transcript_12652/g.19335  ORF Transcript_12652/g.19335 Transcript_12652/m.19335 type:complete len:87 (+) Transcript_12652:260-520(+)